jgi:hypothetical protein
VVKFELARASFFDREAVIKAMDRATRKALSKAGAFVRTRARSSVRKRKAVSEPGSPPSDHGGALKRLLFFAWDAQSRSVVVGPVPFEAARSTGQRPRAPEALEEGGPVTATTRRGKRLNLLYRARPFMGPALEAEVAAGTIPEQFRGSLGG